MLGRQTRETLLPRGQDLNVLSVSDLSVATTSVQPLRLTVAATLETSAASGC